MRKEITIVCAFCANVFTVSSKEFELGGCECSTCYSELDFAETLEQQEEWNKERLEEESKALEPTHYRIMLQGEDGTLSCLKNDVPTEWASLVADGLQTHYTEGQWVFIEPEETLTDLRRMLREDF